MSFDPLEPQYTEEEIRENLAAQHEALANAGGTFTGEGWLLLIETYVPLDEIVFACALEPAIVQNSAGKPTMLTVALAETPHGYVIIFALTFYDNIESPWRVHVLVNPISSDSRRMLRHLAKQETISIHFYDENDGDGLGRRVLPLDQESRTAISDALRATRGVQTTPERWQKLAAFMKARGY